MSDAFVGRAADLKRLKEHLVSARRGPGRLLSIRGRRQVGKSRLITQFIEDANVPHLFATGAQQANVAEDLARFREDIRKSCTLPGRDKLLEADFPNWERALREVADALPSGPAIVVLDEFPWMIQGDPGLEGTMQKLWDRVFEDRRVLFILIGSDLTVMEMLGRYDRPLYGRAREMVVRPFHIGDTAGMLGLDGRRAADAFDAQLVTGGYPRLLLQWTRRRSLRSFITDQLSDENSDVAVSGQRILTSEFPSDVQATRVLRAIGAGERTFRGIANDSAVAGATLSRSLDLLQTKHVVAVDQPTSLRPSTEPRYRVDDPFLRFWLRLVEPGLPDMARGRPDVAVERFWEGWQAYRGRAVEPLVRDSLTRLAVHGAGFVGGWWPRNNNPEVDLVGVDRADRPRQVSFVGSIKWREKDPFDQRDLAVLIDQRTVVPGAAAAPLVVASRRGCRVDEVECFTPDRLLEAWT